VPELAGKSCNELIAVPAEQPDGILVLYLLADSTWHRLFIDEGVLFLNEHAPDREDDLGEGESYVDLAAKLACRGNAIESVRMENRRLTIRLSGNVSLTLSEGPMERPPFMFRADGGDVGPDDWVVRIGAEICTRDELFGLLQATLKLPEYFGWNWDALDDCLRDLHWVQARRVVVRHEGLPLLPDDDLRTYLDILVRAVEDWRPDEQHELVVVFPESAELRVRGLLRSTRRFRKASK
jgi:hypothetical protein